jgi:hypothetical protein
MRLNYVKLCSLNMINEHKEYKRDYNTPSSLFIINILMALLKGKLNKVLLIPKGTHLKF